MKYDEIRHAWNAQAEDEKQWNSLTEAEKIEWAASIAAVKARGPAPIFRPEIKRKLGNLQGKGFRIVGYALEHCNSWSDNRRCTVDSNGLVRWIPSADQEVAAERAARQKAQEEVVFLKERIARAGVEHRRAVHEALQQEREACAQAALDTSQVVSDEELAKAFAGTDFGGADHRNELHVAVLKKASGYHCGHTITTIMRELRLVGASGLPTKKGRKLISLAYHALMVGGHEPPQTPAPRQACAYP